MSNRIPQQRLIVLDLLRIVAAWMVAIFHLAFWSWVPPDSSPKAILMGSVTYPHLVSVSWFGWIGVHIFFVLSGFVIAYSANDASPTLFARRRFLRLFPAAFICATLTFLALLWFGRELQSIILPYLRSVFFHPYGPWIDGVYWSLGIELSFYAVVWLFLYSKSAQYQRLEGAFIVIGMVSAICCSLTFVDPESFQWLSSRTARLLLLLHGVYFSIGALLYLQSIDAKRWRWFFIGMFIVCACLPIYRSGEVHVAFGLKNSPLIPVLVWLASLVIVWMAPRLQSALMIPSLSKLLNVVGLATYPFYLLHDVLGAVLLAKLVVLPRAAPVALSISPIVSLVVVLLMIFCLSIAITQCFEPPFRKLLKMVMSMGH